MSVQFLKHHNGRWSWYIPSLNQMAIRTFATVNEAFANAETMAGWRV